MVSWNFDNIGSGSGLVCDCTKPLAEVAEPMSI